MGSCFCFFIPFPRARDFYRVELAVRLVPLLRGALEAIAILAGLDDMRLIGGDAGRSTPPQTSRGSPWFIRRRAVRGQNHDRFLGWVSNDLE